MNMDVCQTSDATSSTSHQNGKHIKKHGKKINKEKKKKIADFIGNFFEEDNFIDLERKLLESATVSDSVSKAENFEPASVPLVNDSAVQVVERTSLPLFKDAFVQTVEDCSDASVQVNLCQCRNTVGLSNAFTPRANVLPYNSHTSASTSKRLPSNFPAQGSDTPSTQKSLYLSAIEPNEDDLELTNGDLDKFSSSPKLQNVSLQVSMSFRESIYEEDGDYDLKTSSNKRSQSRQHAQNVCHSNEHQHLEGKQLARENNGQPLSVKTLKSLNSGSVRAQSVEELFHDSEPHKSKFVKDLFGIAEGDVFDNSSSISSTSPLSHKKGGSSSSNPAGDDHTARMRLTSTFLDQPGAQLSSEAYSLSESPIEPTPRRSRGFKRVSMCGMNFRGNHRHLEKDSGKKLGSLSIVPDSDESLKTALDRSHNAFDKASENVSRSSESSSDDEFERFLSKTKVSEKKRRSIIPMSKFIVDDSGNQEEDEDDSGGDDDVEEETGSDGNDSDDDDDKVKEIIISSDDEMFDKNVCYESSDVKKSSLATTGDLSHQLKKALHFSSSDDDFESISSQVKKKTGKQVPLDMADARKRLEGKQVSEFRTPGPLISSRDCASSVVTPHTSMTTHMGQIPYTIGHAAPARYGFLKSLDLEVKGHLRDFKAGRYVSNFNSLRYELTMELFELYNKQVFDMKIPSNTRIIWNDRMTATAGWCSYRTSKDNPPTRYVQIELSVKVCDSPDRVRDTLIHEMCHAKVWIDYGVRECHGRLWKSWAQIANKTFPELPRITVYHNYTITTKYVYRCTRCGTRVGRHSKSLDTEKFFCRFCHGQFELLVLSQKSTSSENVLSTPRQPNQFALFVKENYGDLKKATPGMTHGEIMKEIGLQYSAKKTASVKVKM